MALAWANANEFVATLQSYMPYYSSVITMIHCLRIKCCYFILSTFTLLFDLETKAQVEEFVFLVGYLLKSCNKLLGAPDSPAA